MSKQIIVQRISNDLSGNLVVNVLGWYSIAAASQIPISGGVSLWPGASTAENNLIASGAVVEELYTLNYPSNATASSIKSDLLARWSSRQSIITAKLNPNLYLGVFYDPTASGWSA